MACCNNSVSWECCYPDTCSCCVGCIGCACCNGSNCSGDCGGSVCGQGGCCTCDSGNWGYAWKQACPCMCPGCGATLWFSTDCLVYNAGVRVDTHNPNASTIADLTKSLFMQFAPLNQGIISNMRITDTAGSCC